MPGNDVGYADPEKDLYPATEDEHARLLSWVQQAFSAADKAREPYYDRWKRYYKLYRSYLKRKKGDWRSKVFYPMAFWTIETIAPRIVASLPKLKVLPVSEDDVHPARKMEALLDWAAVNSDLYVELVKSVKAALKYGTGILKVYNAKEMGKGRTLQPKMEPFRNTMPQPVLDPDTGEQMYDVAGEPLIEEVVIEEGERPVMDEQGQPIFDYVPTEYVVYEGPKAEAIDIFNFWVAPEAEDIQGARYVIQRTYREMSYIIKKVEEGIYRWPENLGPEDITQSPDQPTEDRAGEIELQGGQGLDATRKAVEILEIWTSDNLVITVANQKAILRVQENPFDHGMKPYVRVVDYLAEHEFWGIGELEPLEGLQDLTNALTNQRVDNVRLVMDRMFGVNVKEIADLSDLTVRPGGVIRVTGDVPANQVIYPLDMGDVTQSAFMEVDHVERTAEKVSGVSAYQLGTQDESLNRTATGVTLINQNASERFSMKTRLMELIGLKPLARMYGSNIQQFIDVEKVIRITGDDGSFVFERYTPESIQGALDYDIEAASSTQTEAVRKDQAMTLFQTVGMAWPQAIPALLEDLLREFGVKDFSRYLGAPQAPMPPMPGQEQMMDPALMAQMDPQMAAAMGAAPLPPGEVSPNGQPQGPVG